MNLHHTSNFFFRVIYFLIRFIGVISVNKINKIEVSGVQF